MVYGLGMLIAVAAGLAAILFSIQLLIMNFKENALWGLASFFFGFPGLIFVVMHWDKAGSTFLKSLGANLAAFVGFAMMNMGS